MPVFVEDRKGHFCRASDGTSAKRIASLQTSKQSPSTLPLGAGRAYRYAMTRVLINGGAGFIGSHIVEGAIKAGLGSVVRDLGLAKLATTDHVAA